MNNTQSLEQDTIVCETCEKTPPGFFKKYQGFLLSPGSLITATNALLLLLGFIAEVMGQQQAANWLFLASAIIGGFPIFKLAAGNIIREFNQDGSFTFSIHDIVYNKNQAELSNNYEVSNNNIIIYYEDDQWARFEFKVENRKLTITPIESNINLDDESDL